jgi:hypothetical protein
MTTQELSSGGGATMPGAVPASLEACLHLLRAQARLVRRFEIEFGEAHGLSLADLQLLVELDRAPGGRLRRIDLAERVEGTAAGVTRMLVPLERIGLVIREPNHPTLGRPGPRSRPPEASASPRRWSPRPRSPTGCSATGRTSRT